MREQHTDAGSALAERRRSRDAARCALLKRTRRSPSRNTDRTCYIPQVNRLEYDALVLRPQRRYDMHGQVRIHVVQSGFHISRITRRDGIGLHKHSSVPPTSG